MQIEEKKKGHKCKKEKLNPKIGLAKHGLNIKKVNKIKIPHFWFIFIRAYGLKREKEKKKKEEGRRKRMRSSGKETIVRMLVWILVWKFGT